MPAALETVPDSRLFFTAPWEPIVVRRGDALGLRALADGFADAVAPDLNNSISDGRWVTILAWSLARSHEVYHASGGRGVVTRAEQNERYAWLRPLELMWVARTIALADDWRKRPLPGRRRVRPWYEDEAMATPRFGMSIDQFRAYRQTGIYGAYRLGFRKWPEMTISGDGWTPGPATISLAKWLDGRLGGSRPPWILHGDEADESALPARSAKLGRKSEDKWWLRQWPTFDQGGRAYENTLPRPKTDFSILPEAKFLTPLLFGSDKNGKKRLLVAREIEKSRATNHIEVCQHLSRVLSTDSTISQLARFSRLADAGMQAMELVAEALSNEPSVALIDVAALPMAVPICEELSSAAMDWQKAALFQTRHIETAHRFASAFPRANPVDCLAELLKHHEFYGGGLRWFVLREGRIEPRTPQRGGSSRYGFRLWSLCRLATQCGILKKMPSSLLANDESEEIQETELVDE